MEPPPRRGARAGRGSRLLGQPSGLFARRAVIVLEPRTLEGRGVRLEPLAREYQDALRAAAADGRLWELWYTSVPEPDQVGAYIEAALAGQEKGHMLPWAVRELEGRTIVG